MTRAMGDEAVSAESVESVKVPRVLASVGYGGSVMTVWKAWPGPGPIVAGEMKFFHKGDRVYVDTKTLAICKIDKQRDFATSPPTWADVK